MQDSPDIMLSGALGIDRALRQAGDLVASSEAFAQVMADLGVIDLPPAAQADTAQLRAIASLYLAATLEDAGLISAAEDLTRLVRTGTLPGELGSAAPLLEAFWRERSERTSQTERAALFSRLFGASGADDMLSVQNAGFEEMLLDLCEAIVQAADGAGQGRVRSLAIRMAENLGQGANEMTLMLARDVIDSIGKAVAILNHPQIKTILSARTLWEAVTAIDRRFRRTARPTLTHLRRGRAGMAVIAWLAESIGSAESGSGRMIEPGDPVVDAAVDWLDETLSIMREAGEQAASQPEPGRARWAELGR